VFKGASLFAVLAVVLAFAGCGGGDDSTLTKAEYTQQLKLACNEGTQARETLIAEITRQYYEEREKPPTPQYQANNLRKLVDTYQATTKKISEIGLPEGEEKKAEAFVRAREEAAAEIEASPLGTRDNILRLFIDPEKKAEALGVGTCDT